MRPLTQQTLGSEGCLEWLLDHPAHQKLLPHALSISQDNNVKLPSELLQHCVLLRKSYLLNSMLLSGAGQELLAALKAADVPAIPMKGPVLANRLYGGLHHRPFGDIDVLVRPDHIAPAIQVVISLGYEDISQNPHMFHLEYTRESKSGQNVRLELHRRLIGYAIGGDHLAFGLLGSSGFTEWCWQRASELEEHWQMRECDELIYFCLHLTKHLTMERYMSADGVACSSLLLARDIQLALEQWGDAVDWQVFLATVERFHFTVPVSLALAFVHRWYACEIPELMHLVERVTSRQARRFFDWADNPATKRSPLVENQRLKMVLEAFEMADRGSDRVRILPLVVGEFFRRQWG